ncbi:MAG: hypothetical protein RL398_1762 [Planctomycetota bacterium]|jgi:HEAT repeat protein
MREQPAMIRVAVAALAIFCCACASEAGFDAGRLDAERASKLRACEAAYRAESAEYAVLREELMSDPVAVHWLTRMFVLDLLRAREGRPLGEDQELLRAAAGLEDPLERRAAAEIVVLGTRAMPVIAGDLLRHPQPQPRELGIELVGRIGPAAVEFVLPLVNSTEARERRVAARALGSIGGEGDIERQLAKLAADADFTVRADAMRGLARSGESGATTLRAALANDPDPFVRRAAATSLARHPGLSTAQALVDYLQVCQRAGDFSGEKAAQESLLVLAGAKGFRSLASWREWLQSLPR